MKPNRRKLAAAVAVFEQLGWGELPPEQFPTASIGTDEQQKVAREGLEEGDWMHHVVDESSGTCRSFDLTGVDQVRLRYFALRVGVSPQRASELFPKGEGALVAACVAAQGREYATEFVALKFQGEPKRTEAPRLDHPGSIRLAVQGVAKYPENAAYLESWATCATHLILGIPEELEDCCEADFPTKEEVLRVFSEHLKSCFSTHTPLAGPLGTLALWAVDQGLLERRELIAECIYQLAENHAQGEHDRLIHLWENTLALSDAECVEHAESLIQLCESGIPRVVKTMGLRLLPLLPAEKGDRLARACLASETPKTLLHTLQVIAALDDPELIARIHHRVQELSHSENPAVARSAQRFLTRTAQTRSGGRGQ